MSVRRHDWYLGRQVLDADLDETSDWLVDAFGAISIDGGLTQDDVSTGTPKIRGGIVKGLDVSQNGAASNLQLDVSVGVCYDDSGDRIELSTQATLTCDYTGAWAEGVKTGSATVGASVLSITSAGDEVVLSLYLVYDEDLSDPQVDLGGSPVNFEITPSFHFELRKGTEYTPPPAGAISRDALANGRVLLCDIIVVNNGGTLEWRANGFCTSNYGWDNVGAGYGPDSTAACDGRRSDYIAFEDSANFGVWRDTVTPQQIAWIRASNPRDALERLCTLLAHSTGGQPWGASLVGCPVDPGNVQGVATGATNLVAGSLRTQLSALLDAINSRACRGGDSILPQAGAHGLTFDPTSLSADRALIQILANVGGAVGRRTVFGRDRGHPAFAHDVFDEFLYIGDASNVLPSDGRSLWAQAFSSGTGTFVLQNQRGGVVRIQTGDALANSNSRIDMGLNAGTQMYWYSLGATPWCIGMCRFRLEAATDIKVKIGFFETNSSVDTDASAYMELDTAVNADIRGRIRNSSGTVNTSVVPTLLAAPDTNWHTVRFASISSSAVAMQIDNQSWETVTCESGTLDTAAGYTFGILVENTTTTQRYIDIDQAFAGDGILADDMAPTA